MTMDRRSALKGITALATLGAVRPAGPRPDGIPDRVSCEDDSPHYCGALLVQSLHIECDGVRLVGCVEADRAHGWARGLCSPDALPVLATLTHEVRAASNGLYPEYVVRGRVTFRRDDLAAAAF